MIATLKVVERLERALYRVCNPVRSNPTIEHEPPSDDDDHLSPRGRDGSRRRSGKGGGWNSHSSISYVSEKSSLKKCDSTYPIDLCANCEKLDVRAMLEEETPEEDMGPLSDHLDMDCPFCRLVSHAVRQAWGEGWDSARLCTESVPPAKVPNLYIQSRSPLTIRRRGGTEHPEPRLLLALTTSPPGHEENRAVIREIDRVKDRFIIAEIESVPTLDNEYRPWIPRRQVKERLDPSLAKSWIKHCKAHKHSREAAERMDYGMFSDREGFRLIDVEEERLVLRTKPSEYAALSYVWGRLPTIVRPDGGDDIKKQMPVLLTTKENLEKLSAPGGLSTKSVEAMHRGRLPNTVTDAMRLTKSIGMRYLWVDTLCIVQDDKADKSILIRSMDQVYDDATVTLIAASGVDANAGLRGVSPRAGLPIDPFTINDEGEHHHLSICPPSLADEVRASTWNTRGWTFQEQSLSQRCLYFTPNEVFFNCQTLQFREAYAMEPGSKRRRRCRDRDAEVRIRTGPPWWNRKLRKDLDATPYRYFGDLSGTLTVADYQSAVQGYSRRRLSFSEDVLHAFEGIFNRFSKGAEAVGGLDLVQTQGIPTNIIHRGLLWFPADETHRRRCDKAEFSSWSWAAWDGPVEFVFADSMWLSRNISQAPMKKMPVHSLVPSWHVGNIPDDFWSQTAWQSLAQSPITKGSGQVADGVEALRSYVAGLGIDAQELVRLARNQNNNFRPRPVVAGDEEEKSGRLSFVGAYIGAGDASLSNPTGKHRAMQINVGGHQGEFRYDDEGGEAEEYVALVTCDTITKTPDQVVILLGLARHDKRCSSSSGGGSQWMSKRVGIGYVYRSKKEDVAPMPWKYRSFQLA